MFRQWLTPGRRRLLFYYGVTLLGLTALFLLGILVHRGLLPIVAYFIPALQTSFYDLAVYGAYPTENYVSFNLSGPAANIVRWDRSCEDGLVLVSPNGKSVADPGPMIVDARGELVWMAKKYGTVMNFRMQQWQGRPHLTFWAGQKTGSLGAGAYFILDSSYNVVKKVHAVGNDYKGDIHEFEITEAGTALFTIYHKTQVDLRPMGWGRPENGWILDSMFQEVDIETGDLLFEWKASEHFRAEETFYTHPFAGYYESIPFDFYHINSIQKDSIGNYLISSRHLHTVTYINGTTGDTEWVLGGDYEDFEDLSDGRASDFRWQHHAQWFSEKDRILSLFDNQAAGPLHEDAPYSKGVLIQLDLEKMTATHLQSYISNGKTRAASQGSVQLLPTDDHVFVGWGSSGAYSEYSIDGRLLCEVHLSAESTYWWERVKSYRAYKVFEWVGQPEYSPEVNIAGNKLYASWNGATEVRYWELQGSVLDEGVDVQGSHKEGEEELAEWQAIEMDDKRGFEHSFTLPSGDQFARYRVAALDAEKMYIGNSDPADTRSGRWSGGAITFCIAAFVGCIIGVWYGLKIWARRQQGQHGKASWTWEMGDIQQALGRARGYEYSKL